MGDIFYSQVDANLQTELNARGRSGFYDRTTNGINFMLEKIANVQIIPYKEQDRVDAIPSAILGGTSLQRGEYLPSGPDGFVTDRKYNYTEREINNEGNIVNKTKEPRTNSSRRIPPFITSLEIAIGDNSNGLLNTATVNITIPNPERDLNFIESVYFRPGRAASIKIEHPQSSIVSYDITAGLITPKTMPSTKKLMELYPNLTPSGSLDYRKMNATMFDGLITSFTFDYQPDMSVTATLSLTGTGQIYPEISLLIDSNEKIIEETKNTELYENKVDAALGIDTGNLVNLSGLGDQSFASMTADQPWSNVPPMPSTKTVANAEPIIKQTIELGTFYTNLSKEVQNVIDNKQKGVPRLSDEQLGYTAEYYSDEYIGNDTIWAVWGDPLKGKSSFQRYITLSWLISYINRVIITKMKKNVPTAKIICTEYRNLVTSIYYEHLVSSDPMKILLAGNNNDVYGDLTWYSHIQPGKNMPFSAASGSNSDSPILSYPTRIFINMEVIQEIVNGLEKNKNFTIASLLSYIGSEIYSATGNAIDLKLITHPELTEYLLFYDAANVNNNPTTKEEDRVIPYSVPMFSNHENGTIVRDFKFSGKLPSDASHLAYSVNQNPSEIAESDIAPFVAYMYSANTVERTGPHETVGNLISQEQLDKIKQQYKEAHEKFVDQLNIAKKEFGKNPTNPEKRAALKQAMQKYLQYPKPTIVASNQLTAPVIPFDVEFTIDGINGLRYGDVLTFDGLPTRYKQNAVFSIVGINHTVGNDGMWTTSVRCIMRPNIDL
jgi:hypothetical protein